MTVIHEMSTPMWVYSPLGEGMVIALIDYGINHNIVFFVMLKSGQFRCVDSVECRCDENPMLGITKPKT